MFHNDFEELEAFDKALSALADVPVSCLSAEELATYLSRLPELKARLESIACTLTAAAETAGTHTLGPSRTIGSWVGSHTNADPASAARDRTVGVWLRGFGEFAEAFAAGALTRRHIDLLRGIDNSRTHAALVDAQDYLIQAGRDCSFRDFRKVLARWLIAGDPDGAEPKEQLARRHLSITVRPDGSVKGTFDLDPIAGAALRTAVNHRAEQLWRDDQASGSDRTNAQRRADALVELVANGFRRQDGSTPRPLVHIVMSPAVAEDAMRRITGDLLHTDDPFRLPVAHDVDHRCQLADGTPLHPFLGVAGLAIGTFRRLVYGSDSDTIDLGRAVRDFPAHFRDAVMAIGEARCSCPGCDAPPEWLQIDHVIPWARGGPTALWNAKLLCDPDNKAKADTMPGSAGRR